MSSPTETTTPHPTEPIPNTIASAVAALRAQHEKNVIAAREQDQLDAVQSWEEYETNRRTKRIKSYLSNCEDIPDPYKDQSDETIYRISRPYETRLEDLLKVGAFVSATKVWLFRNRSRGYVKNLKVLLAPYMEVDGTETIDREQSHPNTGFVTYAEGLSEEFKRFLLTLEYGDWSDGEGHIELDVDELLVLISSETTDHYGNRVVRFAHKDKDEFDRRRFDPAEW